LPPQLQVDDALHANFQRAMEIQAGIFRRGQETGELRAGDPLVLARLLSGIVATYQLLDPAVVSDDAEPDERLPLATLHEMIAGAFRA
jgi:hypothetical protein